MAALKANQQRMDDLLTSIETLSESVEHNISAYILNDLAETGRKIKQWEAFIRAEENSEPTD